MQSNNPVGLKSAIGAALSASLLWEFFAAIGLSFGYFLKPKATLNYPFEKGPLSPRFSR